VTDFEERFAGSSVMKHFAARLHVLMARESPVGVVIRRGPTRQVATFLWDRRKDKFTLGQWLNGRIYERRSDLSPDGKHLIYFAMNGKWRSETQGSWTAISRAPYLKAISLFAKGDCWDGGGLWISNRRVWLNGGYSKVLKDARVIAYEVCCRPTDSIGHECWGVYVPRLIRDGWKLADRLGGYCRCLIFDKPMGSGWTLRKIAVAGASQQGKGCYWDEHELIAPQSASNSKDGLAHKSIACPDWQWADVDGSRVVWAAHGKLHAAQVSIRGLENQVVLHDFNDMHFQAVEAPY
jgi:hypothetical protein